MQAKTSGWARKGFLACAHRYFNNTRRKAASASVAGALCLTGAVAQAAAGDDLQQRSQEQERRAQERFEQLEKLTPRRDVNLSPEPSKTLSRIPDGEAPCFVIGELHLQLSAPDTNAEPWAWLLDQADGHGILPEPDPVLGRCLGAQGIQTVVDRLQQALVARGYITSRLYAPPQNLQGGQLALQLVPGRVRAVRWSEGSGQRGSRWNTVALQPGDILNLRDIEQSLENFKRVPTAEADINIAPADEPGYSDLLISHTQPQPFRLNVTADDSGSSTTGKYQGSFTFSYDNWWTLSDLFYVTWQGDLGGADPGPRGTRGQVMHYSVPWGYNLLSFTASSNRYHQSVAGANANVLYSGTSAQADVKLSRVIQRDSVGKTVLSLKGFQRRSNNYIDDTEVEVQRRVVAGLEWGLNVRRAWAPLNVEANLGYRVGTGAWGALPAPEEAFGEGTSRMRLWLADVSVQAPLDLGGRRWNWNTQWRWQRESTPLTPQDRFSIGGRYTVRGYDGLSVLSAERGWLLRNELSTPLTPQIQAYVGVDYGHVGGPSAEQLVGQNLTGAVLGLRGQAGPLQWEVFAGTPLRKPNHFKTSNTTAGFNLSVSY